MLNFTKYIDLKKDKINSIFIAWKYPKTFEFAV